MSGPSTTASTAGRAGPRRACRLVAAAAPRTSSWRTLTAALAATRPRPPSSRPRACSGSPIGSARPEPPGSRPRRGHRASRTLARGRRLAPEQADLRRRATPQARRATRLGSRARATRSRSPATAPTPPGPGRARPAREPPPPAVPGRRRGRRGRPGAAGRRQPARRARSMADVGRAARQQPIRGPVARPAAGDPHPRCRRRPAPPWRTARARPRRASRQDGRGGDGAAVELLARAPPCSTSSGPAPCRARQRQPYDTGYEPNYEPATRSATASPPGSRGRRAGSAIRRHARAEPGSTPTRTRTPPRSPPAARRAASACPDRSAGRARTPPRGDAGPAAGAPRHRPSRPRTAARHARHARRRRPPSPGQDPRLTACTAAPTGVPCAARRARSLDPAAARR